MKFTTLTTALLCFGFAADTASAACCNLKVCDGFGNKGNCMGGCYPYGKTVNIDRSGLKSSIGSAKTASDCKCTFGKNSKSCMLVDSKGRDAPKGCLTGINKVYCMRK